jgi:hypothetical protein
MTVDLDNDPHRFLAQDKGRRATQHSKISAESLDTIVMLRRKGMTWKAIGERYGVGGMAVRAALDRAGLL